MNNPFYKLIFVSGTAFVFLSCSFAQDQNMSNKDMSIGTVEEGVSIFDLNEDGRRAWELHGTSAQFLDDGFVAISEVTLYFYGKTNVDDVITVQSPAVEVNQTTKLVRTDQPVTITSKDMIITGNGLDGNMKVRQVQIKENVKVVLTGQKSLFFEQ